MMVSNLTAVAAAFVVAIVSVDAIERILPVVYGMEGVDGQRIGETYTTEVYGSKLLDCTVVPDSFEGWHLVEDVWIENGPIEFIDDLTPNSSRPTGKQGFGTWQWSGVPEDATEVRVTLLHNCDGDIRVTIAGPFEIEG